VVDFIYKNGAGRERIYALVGENGAATRLKFATGVTMHQGAQLPVSGHAKRGAVIVEQHESQLVPKTAAASSKIAVEGSVQLRHADYFEGGTTHFLWILKQDGGAESELDLPIAPVELRSGMRVSVSGERGSAAIVPDSIAVVAEAPATNAGPIASAVNNKVLVILLNFKGTATQPFTQTQANTTFFGTGG